jgi:hypothetical protein
MYNKTDPFLMKYGSDEHVSSSIDHAGDMSARSVRAFAQNPFISDKTITKALHSIDPHVRATAYETGHPTITDDDIRHTIINDEYTAPIQQACRHPAMSPETMKIAMDYPVAKTGFWSHRNVNDDVIRHGIKHSDSGVRFEASALSSSLERQRKLKTGKVKV